MGDCLHGQLSPAHEPDAKRVVHSVDVGFLGQKASSRELCRDRSTGKCSCAAALFVRITSGRGIL